MDDKTRCAFEVEDVQTRKNYSFVYEPASGIINMFNTSRGEGNQLLTSMPNDSNDKPDFPFKCKNAYDYFIYMYGKSLRDGRICFLGWVTPDTFVPLEEEE